MKIRGEVSSAAQHFEFENFKKFRENARAASETEEYRNIARCITVNRNRMVGLANHVTKYVIVHFLFWSCDQ